MAMNDDLREQRLQQLEQARALSIECSYDAALDLIEKLLLKHPDDAEVLRLKGNILEQKALDLNEYKRAKLTKSRDYLLARECYERVLRVDPRNTLALIDLGDHYKNLDAYDKAFSCYEQAIDLLRSGESRIGLRDEVEELLGTCLDLSRQKQTAERAQRLKLACEQLLGNDAR
jgi:tetratricopeptide (TPR) repeat protein